LLGAVVLLHAGVLANTVIPLDANWRYFKGVEEASSPRDAWRQIGFNDSTWASGPAPFHYGEDVAGGTLITDMRHNYTTFFLRHTFTLANVEDIGALTLRIAADDGFIAWINGQEVARYRVSVTDPSFDDFANSNAPEPVEFASYLVPNETGLLVDGPNVLAVQMFNVTITSSDLQFHAEVTSALTDSDPPTLLAVAPLPGGVAQLTEVTVTFSEAVAGVDAEDLLINDVAADTLDSRGTSFTFGFAQPPFGMVDVRFDPAHGITDFALPANDFDETAANATWSYGLSDSLPPQVVDVRPPPGMTVRVLGEIEVRFSEPVLGLDAADLLVNGTPATNVTGILTGPYRFTFPVVEAGAAMLAWAPGHDIVDTSEPPNPFLGGDWEYTVDPGWVWPDVVISEILAANITGLKDEDGEAEDWIELLNQGNTAADLSGWSLSDEVDSPGKWVFPAISLGAGQRLLVFASGKDRRTPGAEWHTNFKLGTDGEYLGLFNAEQPRQVISELTPEYPEQRNDHSYGRTATGEWVYFANPTPRLANGTSSITDVTPGVSFSAKRGFSSEPFDLTLNCDLPGATIRFTLDGSEPTASTGSPYTAPIHVDQTRVVRAAAYAPDRLPSKVKTHTYLFIDSIVQQPSVPDGFPAQWGARVVTTGDYAMDPRIVDSAQYGERVREGLSSLPALSLVMPVDDWFSPGSGIYSNGDREGIAWERATSLELITPDGGNGFQEDCGLRIQGGTSTNPWKSYKLSMQARFRSDYGSAWLEESVFKDTPVERFDVLIVDAGLNYVWSYGGGSGPSEQRSKAKYLTDQFASDLQLATGGLAVHGRYVNVFINGLYWGLHNLHEEPEAAFGSTYIGGDEADYDVIKHRGSDVLDGNGAAWNEMMQTARSGLSNPANYAALGRILDIPAFIDYMLVHFYIGNTDWPHHNWYALRKREPGGKWYFISWDSEHSLKSVSENRTGVDNSNTCAELYSLLRQNPEFRLLFADRVQRHFFNGGPFHVNPASPAWDPVHPENNRPAALYNQRVAEIDAALVAESARWGDNQRPELPYTRDVEYEDTLRELNESYFPQRSAIVLDQLRNAGLYPNVEAPTLSQHGGRVTAGFRLSISAPAGVIWYTTDGVDPRVPGSGAVAPAATRYAGLLDPFADDTSVKARALSGGTWSALTEAQFQLSGPGLPIVPTELMYHASGGSEFDYLEMVNVGGWPIDLSAFSFSGIDHVFPPGSMAEPGQPILLVSDENPAAFAARYPGVNPAAYYAGGLSNGGETVSLKDGLGQIVWQVDYGDDGAWPELADGDGFSLELVRPDGDLSEPASWRESVEAGGSPGVWNGPPKMGEVRLNEVLALGATPDAPDFVELHNAGIGAVNLHGWTLRDEGGAGEFAFAAETILGAGAFLVVWCDGRTGESGFHAPFALDRDADSVVLRDADGRTVDAVSFGHQIAAASLGRFVADGEWQPCQPTPGTANISLPLAGPGSLRINEWFSNPLPGEDDWLELYNPAGEPVSLAGLGVVTGIGRAAVRSLAVLEPGGFAVLIADDQNGPGHLTLKLPADGGFIRLLDAAGGEIDEITYDAQAENVAEGRLPDGAALIKALGAITPGASNSDDPAESDRDRDGLPDEWETAMGLDPGSSKGDNGANGDPDEDGVDNLGEWQAGTNPLISDIPLVLGITRGDTGEVVLKLFAEADEAYRFDYRESLTGGDWIIWRYYNPGMLDGEVTIIIPEAATAATRFYRLVVP
jgi:hypothetical protein